MKKKIDLSRYTVGAILDVAACKLREETTKPPPRYTEASLLDDMVNASKFATNENDREALKLSNGIGTARTREPVISSHKKRENFIVQKGSLISTPKARALVDATPEALRSPVMTAKWEMMFGGIVDGRMTITQVTGVIVKFITAVIAAAKQQKTQAPGKKG